MSLNENIYQVRRKFWQFLGATVKVVDQSENVILNAKMKAFKLREEIGVYKGEGKENLYLAIKARQIIDFGATYAVTNGEGVRIGGLQRNGFKSLFVSDEWKVLDTHDNEIGKLVERSAIKSIVRRYLIDALSFLLPQKYDLYDAQGNLLASMEQNMNPFIYKLDLNIKMSDHSQIKRRMIFAGAFLLATIEGKE